MGAARHSVPNEKEAQRDMPLTLRQGIGIGPGTLAAFVGGGGKTSLMVRLVEECTAAGLRVICTTTTRIFPPSLPTFSVGDSGDVPPEAVSLLGRGQGVCLHRGVDDAGKLTGVDPRVVGRWRDVADVVLVEADGSRGLPLKAPKEGEPVVPPDADVFIPVAGMTAIGRPLAEGAVHRPERVAALLGVPMGTPVTPAMVARLLIHPQGGLKGKPPKARVVPVLGQGDAVEAAQANAVVEALLAHGASRVVVAAPRTDRPVRRVAGPVAGLVLAAGSARRWGPGHKLLHTVDGRTILEHALAAPLMSRRLREVVVVTGARREAVTSLLQRYPVRIVHNPDHEQGMASSMRAGIRALYPADRPPGYEPPAAFIVLLGDQPFFTADGVDRLVERWLETDAPVVAPQWEGRWRNPVLFASRLVPELMAVEGDEGGRAVVRAYADEAVMVPFEDGRLFADVDTRDDLHAIGQGEPQGLDPDTR